MTLTRRAAMLATAGTMAAGSAAWSQQDWPNQPIRALVGFPAGSGADILCRYFAQKLQQTSGTPVIVENRPGATSNIAIGLAAKAKPDGHTFLFAANSNMAGSRFLFKDLPFDTIKDFTPAAVFSISAFVLAVGAASPVRTLQELTQLLRSKPRSTYGYANQLSLISTEYYKSLAQVRPEAVAYKGGPDAVADVVGGALDFIMLDGTFAAGQVRSGRLRPLAVTTAQRIAMMPDVPTMQESGLTGYEFAAWWGAFLPSATPQHIVDKLGGWLNEISRSDETRLFMESIAGLPMHDDSAAAKARLLSELEKWGRVVKAAGIEPQ